MTQKIINEQRIPTCLPIFWNNETLLNNIFDYNLRKRLFSNSINWRQFFQSNLACAKKYNYRITWNIKENVPTRSFA